MNKELYVSSTPHETRVALVEDDALTEVFFERENEYTLAGSIYKGRVTRVLPGMQSAFVDIGLERDAFLYVSDFLELGGEDGDEEFGEIAAPRVTVDVRQSQQSQSRAEAQGRVSEAEDEVETETVIEDFAAPANEVEESEEESEAETGSTTPNEESESGEGARRWRGRRRRRGVRRGRNDEPQLERSEPRVDPRNEQRSEPVRRERFEERQTREDYGPPPGYTPIILPGESISKYRGATPQPQPTAEHFRHYAEPLEGEHPIDEVEEVEQGPAVEKGHAATEPEQLEWAGHRCASCRTSRTKRVHRSTPGRGRRSHRGGSRRH